jgi:hypothetical protein
MVKFAPVPIKIMEKKFYIKELLQFLLDKRQAVFLDDDFIFTVEEFKKFIAENKLPKEMFDKTTFYSIEESLKYLKEMDIRDAGGHIINTRLPLLEYVSNKKRTGFKIQNSRKEYLENTKNYIEGLLSPDRRGVAVVNKEVKINEINKTNDIAFKLDSGLLTLNKNIGWVKLNKTETGLNPKSKEFQVLLKLITSNDGQATYGELLGEDNAIKPNKRLLTFTIRNLKHKLGILPAKNQVNKNIIHNVSGVGYRLK